MATKPKAILSTHDGREATVITKASNVLFEDGRTAQDILNDRQDAMISPVIENSSSMFKVGQGDNVDYSDNVVNGAYESMVLKGKSMVNCIQESSSQDVVLPYEFEEGQYATINDTKESGALGMELKGQTLVNLSNNLDDKTMTITGYYLNEAVCSLSLLSENKTYSILFYVSDVSGTHENYKFIDIGVGNTGMSFGFYNDSGEATKYIINKNGWTIAVFNYSTQRKETSETNGYEKLFIRPLRRNTEPVSGETITFTRSGYTILEGDWSTKINDLPFNELFEGMQSVQVPSVTTIGKNLFDGDTFKQNAKKIPTYTINGSILKWQNSGVSQNYTLIEGIFKKETKYTFSLRSGSSNNVNLYVCYTDGTKKWFNGNLTTESNKTIEKITPVHNDGSYTTLDINDFQIEESPTPTTYEPYKSTTLTLPEEITLRGIGSVKDTLNTVTGEYTQRIGEVVLDGSENWLKTADYTNTIRFQHPNSTVALKPKTNTQNIVSDMLPYNSAGQDIEGIDTHNSQNLIQITIDRNKLSSSDASGFKTYLQSNPITVQYELATPITSTVSLTFTNQDNQPTTKLSTYNTTTHINASSQEGSLIPTLSHVNPSYPVILKPSTKYSIVADSYSNGHTNSPINFDLGGATVSTTVGNRVSTVTTPSTLTGEKLVMSGRGNMLNNVMVIEGDVVGDEPYFEGICDSKSPILLNRGKNLFDEATVEMNCYYYSLNGVKTYNSKVHSYTISTTPNHTYSIKVFGTAKTSHVTFWDESMRFLGGASGTDDVAEKIFTTPSDCVYVKFPIHNTGMEECFVFDLDKSNILSCNGDKIELTQDMFEQGAFGYIGGTTREDCINRADASLKNYRIRSKQLIKINPNASYRILISNKDYTVGLQGFDDKQISIGYDTYWKSDDVITTPSNMHYCNILIKKSNDKTITPSDFDNANIEIREIDKTIVLRSLPNGVCDTLNVETGEYVQRISEVMLDGSEDWDVWQQGGDHLAQKTVVGFGLNLDDAPTTKNFYVLCDHFATGGTTSGANNDHTYYVYHKELVYGYYANASVHHRLGLSVSKTKLGIPNDNTNATQALAGLRTYLASNPATVQYELATPIVSTINVQGFPHAYKDGHVQLSSGHSGQSLTPTIEYSLPINRNGQIRSNQKMVEKHQKELDQLQAIVLANLVNSQYNQTLTTLNYELSRV